MRYPLVVFDFDGTLADSFGPAGGILTRPGPPGPPRAHPAPVFACDRPRAGSFGPAVDILTRIGPGLGLKPIADLETARTNPPRQLLKQIGARLPPLPGGVGAA